MARQRWHGGAGKRGKAGSAGFELQRHLEAAHQAVVLLTEMGFA